MNTEQKCRVCGCTEEDCTQCVEAQGTPCYWVDIDLCSRCFNEMNKDIKEKVTITINDLKAAVTRLRRDLNQNNKEEFLWGWIETNSEGIPCKIEFKDAYINDIKQMFGGCSFRRQALEPVPKDLKIDTLFGLKVVNCIEVGNNEN